MDLRNLTQLSCRYIAICIDYLYPTDQTTEMMRTWLAALRIGTGKLLRLRIAVVFWGVVAPALGSNTVVKVIAARLNEHGIRIRGQDSLHLLIENA